MTADTKGAKPVSKPRAKQTAKGRGVGAKSPARKPGRPTDYTEKLVTAICTGIAEGMSLRKVCELDGMPSISTVLRWLADDARQEFRDQYARAREAQADFLAEEILSIADEQCTMVRADKHGSRDDDGDGGTEVVFDSTAVARNRLRVDARKWLASKMAPKKYGDKIEATHTGPNGGPIQSRIAVEFVRPRPVSEGDE
jgi:hypothetical protein